uniref:Uncharacterized protein n=1 Tax=Phaeomonas parva TaxID=124430 RepID=A0A6U4H302_9STRA|mmetsp:Transcript_31861/g.101401  ORF Transcript_31861/g.101401 Transcript_31861/m.101401 type:complete len:486 (+) Transcript_31861:750-2207(+)
MALPGSRSRRPHTSAGRPSTPGGRRRQRKASNEEGDQPRETMTFTPKIMGSSSGMLRPGSPQMLARSGGFFPVSPLGQQMPWDKRKDLTLTRKRQLDEQRMEYFEAKVRYKQNREDIIAEKMRERQRKIAWLIAVAGAARSQTLLGIHERLGKIKEMRLIVTMVLRIQAWWRAHRFAAFPIRNERAIMVMTSFLGRVIRKFRNRRRAHAAGLLRSFLNDANSAGRVAHSIVRFRTRIVYIQRAMRAYLACKRARLELLTLFWDKVEAGKRAEKTKRKRRPKSKKGDPLAKTDDERPGRMLFKQLVPLEAQQPRHYSQRDKRLAVQECYKQLQKGYVLNSHVESKPKLRMTIADAAALVQMENRRGSHATPTLTRVSQVIMAHHLKAKDLQSARLKSMDGGYKGKNEDVLVTGRYALTQDDIEARPWLQRLQKITQSSVRAKKRPFFVLKRGTKDWMLKRQAHLVAQMALQAEQQNSESMRSRLPF